MILEKIEDSFKIYFQSNIKICNGNSILKQGKFILLRSNAFSIDFLIKTQKADVETITIPLPFNFYQENKTFHFDYNIENLTVKGTASHEAITDYIRKNKTSKYLNTKISFTFE